MNGHQDTLPNDVPPNEELSAYLDGELDAATRRELEQRLSESGELRQRLKEYQQTWDLLDDLPRADVNESFTRTTVEMVAIRAEDAIVQTQDTTRRRRVLAWAVGLAASLAMATVGYLMTAQYFDRPNQQLVEDLPILEHFDAYRNAGSLEFLRDLHDQKLFPEDSGDAI